jgi:Flp pilus assembly protein TadG
MTHGEQNMVRRNTRERRGAVTVEAAIVLPVLLFLLLMLLIGGIGVFRYQQVACLAREGTRWASVRGTGWQMDTGQTPPTQQDILQNAVLPLAVGMDPNAITIQAEWLNGETGAVTAWDSSPKSPLSLSKTNQGVSNRIRVTVNYVWTPGVLIPGSLNMSSVSEVAMMN